MNLLIQLRSWPKGWKTGVQAVIFFSALGPFGILTLYGLSRWPNAPIREEAGLYLDKKGHIYTAADFHSFEKWQHTFYLCTLFCILAFATSWATGKLLKNENGA